MDDAQDRDSTLWGFAQETSQSYSRRQRTWDTTWTNWAGTVTSRPRLTTAPPDATALLRTVDRAVATGERIRVVGAGHSFSPAAATNGIQVSLEHFTAVESVIPHPDNPGEHLLTVGAGIRLQELNSILAGHNLALANLGDIDLQSLAGAFSTGTHGTGVNLPGLAGFVYGVRILVASGEIMEISLHKNAHLLPAVAVSLGALGIIIAVTLRCVPAFHLHAHDKPSPLAEVLESLNGPDGLIHSNDHMEFFWFPGTTGTLLKTSNRVPVDAEQKPHRATQLVHDTRAWIDEELLANGLFQFTNSLSARVPALAAPVNILASRALTAREYVAPSHEVFVSQRRVKFVEMEYAIPLEALHDTFVDVMRIANRKDFSVQFPVEVRTGAADDLWLSPAQGRTTAYVAIHQYQHSRYREYFDTVEEVFRSVGGRPHWGKMHTLGSEDFAQLYPHFGDFHDLRASLDPRGTFTNHYTNKVFGRVS